MPEKESTQQFILLPPRGLRSGGAGTTLSASRFLLAANSMVTSGARTLDAAAAARAIEPVPYVSAPVTPKQSNEVPEKEQDVADADHPSHVLEVLEPS